MQIIEINKNDAGQRLDKFLSKALKNLPAPLMYKFIRTKKIKVNRKRAEPNTILHEGDVVHLFISDEFFSQKNTDEVFRKINPKLDVLYEDENIILCEKYAGMTVHSDEHNDSDTLIDNIKAYLYKKGKYDPDSEHSFAPALCNRIDRNTGGIVICAKNAEALREMNRKIKENKVTKKYLCLVNGVLKAKSGTLRGYLYKISSENKVIVHDKKEEFYKDKSIKNLIQSEIKEIITKYKVLDEKGDTSLLEVELVTGRTHQIRAHFAHIGHPLVGDGKYGTNKDVRHKGYKYQALYSYKLTFDKDKKRGVLSYLEGKTFEVNKSKIWFINDFYKEKV